MKTITSNLDAKATRPHLDETLASDARRFGHHGIINLIEIARMRERVTITADYAAELLRRAGHPARP